MDPVQSLWRFQNLVWNGLRVQTLFKNFVLVIGSFIRLILHKQTYSNKVSSELLTSSHLKVPMAPWGKRQRVTDGVTSILLSLIHLSHKLDFDHSVNHWGNKGKMFANRQVHY